MILCRPHERDGQVSWLSAVVLVLSGWFNGFSIDLHEIASFRSESILAAVPAVIRLRERSHPKIIVDLPAAWRIDSLPVHGERPAHL